MVITYEVALQNAKEWATSDWTHAPDLTSSMAKGNPADIYTYAERCQMATAVQNESMKWSMLAVAIAAGKPETWKAQR